MSSSRAKRLQEKVEALRRRNFKRQVDKVFATEAPSLDLSQCRIYYYWEPEHKSQFERVFHDFKFTERSMNTIGAVIPEEKDIFYSSAKSYSNATELSAFFHSAIAELGIDLKKENELRLVLIEQDYSLEFSSEFLSHQLELLVDFAWGESRDGFFILPPDSHWIFHTTYDDECFGVKKSSGLSSGTTGKSETL